MRQWCFLPVPCFQAEDLIWLSGSLLIMYEGGFPVVEGRIGYSDYLEVYADKIDVALLVPSCCICCLARGEESVSW